MNKPVVNDAESKARVAIYKESDDTGRSIEANALLKIEWSQ